MNQPPFSALGLPEPLLAAVEQLGYEEPSSIQALSIPLALEGKDLIGLSETGSGKTAAFGLAGLARIDVENPEPQMLVICPTRELAVQVCAEVQRLGAKLPRLRSVAVYGGAPIDRQIRALHQGVQVVVGTPGRLIDHVERGTLDLSSIRLTVLDEADRMLDMGFADEMEALLRALPEDRQTLFFSATMNDAVGRIIQRYGRDPQLVQVQRESLTVESIEQVCYEARQRSRIELISRLLDLEQPRLSIVFCNTKRAVDECTEELLARGYAADRLHGDIAQTMRERVLRLFREGTVEVLVATDVAARGIDVNDVDLVFNYELPQDPEDYVHRIGRTGRAGRSGKAVSFIHGRDIHRIKTIERYTRQRIVRAEIPTAAEVENRLAEQLLERVRERLQEGNLEAATASLQPLREEGFEWEPIAAVLMSLLREENSREGEEIAEDHSPAPRERRDRRERDDREERPAHEAPNWEPHGGERRERRPRPQAGDGPEPGMVKLFLSLGKNQRIQPGDIVGMLHNECHLERGTVGRIQLFPNFTLVEVAESEAAHAISSASQATLRGLTFKIDYDRGRPEGGPRREDRGDRGDRYERPRQGYGSGAPSWSERGRHRDRDDRRGDDRRGGYGRPSNRDRYDRGKRDRY